MKYINHVRDNCANNDVHPKGDIIKSIIRECLREIVYTDCLHVLSLMRSNADEEVHTWMTRFLTSPEEDYKIGK